MFDDAVTTALAKYGKIPTVLSDHFYAFSKKLASLFEDKEVYVEKFSIDYDYSCSMQVTNLDRTKRVFFNTTITQSECGFVIHDKSIKLCTFEEAVEYLTGEE